MSDSWRQGRAEEPDGWAKRGDEHDEDRDDPQGEGIASKQMEASITVETAGGRVWRIPYFAFVPCDSGAVGGRRQAFRFMAGEEPHDLVVEGDGSLKFWNILMQIARHRRVTLRGKGCVRAAEVVKVGEDQ
jgi:hypothetical protein